MYVCNKLIFGLLPINNALKAIPEAWFTPLPDGCPLVPPPGSTSGETGSPAEFEMLLGGTTLFAAFGGLPCDGP